MRTPDGDCVCQTNHLGRSGWIEAGSSWTCERSSTQPVVQPALMVENRNFAPRLMVEYRCRNRYLRIPLANNRTTITVVAVDELKKRVSHSTLPRRLSSNFIRTTRPIEWRRKRLRKPVLNSMRLFSIVQFDPCESDRQTDRRSVGGWFYVFRLSKFLSATNEWVACVVCSGGLLSVWMSLRLVPPAGTHRNNKQMVSQKPTKFYGNHAGCANAHNKTSPMLFIFPAFHPFASSWWMEWMSWNFRCTIWRVILYLGRSICDVGGLSSRLWMNEYGATTPVILETSTKQSL